MYTFKHLTKSPKIGLKITFKTGLQEEGNWYKLKQIDFVQVFFTDFFQFTVG
jgi:hypothetical protein